jgi:hypothetical protein
MKLTASAQGVDLVIRELHAFNRDALKILYKEVGAAIKIMRATAQSKAPQQVLSGTRRDALGPDSGARPAAGWGKWIEAKSGRDLSWNAGKVRSGMRQRVSTAKTARGLMEVRGIIENKSAQGAIFSLAGSRNPNNSTFTREIIRRYGHGDGIYPRMMTPAWRQHIDQVRAEVQQAIEKAAVGVGR